MTWNKFIGLFVGIQGFCVAMSFFFFMLSGNIDMEGINEYLNYFMVIVGWGGVVLSVFLWRGSKVSHTILSYIVAVIIIAFIIFSIADYGDEQHNIYSSLANLLFYAMILLPPIFLLFVLQRSEIKSDFGK